MSGDHTKDVRWDCTASFMADVIARGGLLAEDDENWEGSHPRRDGQGDDRNPFRRYMEDGSIEGPGMSKWVHYAEPYHRHLGKFIGRAPVVVEVGVCFGGSLRMWRRIFGEGCRVHGVDCSPQCARYADDATTIHIADQSDREFWDRFRGEVPHVDILIDDGGHDPAEQIVTMEEMMPHIALGGVYICEDVHHRGNPFFGFACATMDRLHDLDPDSYGQVDLPESWSDATAFQSKVGSFHVYPFMVVVEKRSETLARFSCPKIGTEWLPVFRKDLES